MKLSDLLRINGTTLRNLRRKFERVQRELPTTSSASPLLVSSLDAASSLLTLTTQTPNLSWENYLNCSPLENAKFFDLLQKLVTFTNTENLDPTLHRAWSSATHGALRCIFFQCALLLTNAAESTEQSGNDFTLINHECQKFILPFVLKHVDHDELRVRSSVCACVHALSLLAFNNQTTATSPLVQVNATIQPLVTSKLIWKVLGPWILKGIRSGFEEMASQEYQDALRDKAEGDAHKHSRPQQNEAGFRVRSNSNDSLSSLSSEQALRHTTMGWKTLETCMNALRAFIAAQGTEFLQFLYVNDDQLVQNNSESVLNSSVNSLNTNYNLTTKELFQFIDQGVLHINRFVRETSYGIVADLSTCLGELEESESAHWKSYWKTVASFIAKLLPKGLRDNWSQVRYASSVATRCFLIGRISLDQNLPLVESPKDPLQALNILKGRTEYLSDMLPAMCINRHYVAQGVRLYSQATWSHVCRAPSKIGIQALCEPQVLSKLMEFYVEQSEADNHAVREAACHCIAEAAVKLDQTKLSPFVSKLLEVMLVCFKDESWPVRQAACVATGRFASAFYPEIIEDETKMKLLHDLEHLWKEHLYDNIWSVREDSALTFAMMMPLSDDIHSRCLDIAKEYLLKAKEQPKGPSVHTHSKPGPFGNVQHEGHGHGHSHDDSRFENQPMFSCGSLAPKLKRKAGGCMDHGFRRPPRLWEYTDGALYLTRELTTFQGKNIQAEVKALIHSSIDVLDLFHFSDATILRTTAWNVLLPIAKCLGKAMWKSIAQASSGSKSYMSFLDRTIPCLVRELTAKEGTPLSRCAAMNYFEVCEKMIGEMIMKARVESAQLNYTGSIKVETQDWWSLIQLHRAR